LRRDFAYSYPQDTQKNELKPHLRQIWCIGKINAEFIARMEEILWLYGQPYDPQYPVVCFDERPCFLIGELVEPLAMQSGQVRKEHYAYEKNGSCALLAAIEPLTGRRLAQVQPQRTKREYALFLKELAESYPDAVKIRLVQDNLSTHTTSAFYEQFLAAEAFALSQRFEFYYTPKSASWLNLIECEFSALVRQCLGRRIPTIKQLEKEVLALIKERSEKQIKINWQFSIEAARSKMNRHYERVLPDNSKYKVI
jgi:DDE superfamily endonuclease